MSAAQVRSTMESFTAALDEHAKQGYRCTAMEVGGGAYLAWFQKMLYFEMSQMADKGFKQHRWQMAEGYDGMSSMVTSVRNRNREVITAMVTDGSKYVAWVEPSTNYAAEEPGAYLVAAGNTYTFNAFIHGVLKNNKNLFLTSYLFGEGGDGAPTMVGILQKDWPHVWNDLDGSEYSNSESSWATRETAASMASWIQERIVGASPCPLYYCRRPPVMHFQSPDAPERHQIVMVLIYMTWLQLGILILCVCVCVCRRRGKAVVCHSTGLWLSARILRLWKSAIGCS